MKNSHMKAWLLATCASLCLSACAPNVMVQQDPGAALPGPATYAWDSQPGPAVSATAPNSGKEALAKDRLPGDDNPRVNNDIVNSMLHSAIGLGLEKRGYRQTPDHPAWLVSYNIGLRTRVDVIEEAPPPARIICRPFYGCFEDYSYDWGWGWYGDPLYGTRTVHRDENTIMIDLRDAGTRKLVWRGILTQDINLKKDLQPDTLQKAVDSVLEKLPGTGGIK